MVSILMGMKTAMAFPMARMTPRMAIQGMILMETRMAMGFQTVLILRHMVTTGTTLGGMTMETAFPIVRIQRRTESILFGSLRSLASPDLPFQAFGFPRRSR